jgi:hypothetical protein
MPDMRACVTANAVCLGLVFAASGFTACAGGATPPGAPSAQESTAAPPVAAAPAAAASASPQATPPPGPKGAPATPADCKELVSDITNDPPAGVAVNNAQTAKDAGASDRFEPLTDLIRSKRDGFRCCFDLWARSHPGAQGAMKMVIELKKDGAVTNVSFTDAPNRVDAPEVESCMIELARGLAYPKSPSGKDTRFTYPFDFKAHR